MLEIFEEVGQEVLKYPEAFPVRGELLGLDGHFQNCGATYQEQDCSLKLPQCMFCQKSL